MATSKDKADQGAAQAAALEVSTDAKFSEYREHPDPNPDDIRPAPGPMTEQVLGVASED